MNTMWTQDLIASDDTNNASAKNHEAEEKGRERLRGRRWRRTAEKEMGSRAQEGNGRNGVSITKKGRAQHASNTNDRNGS
jgi:hypothetical protein